MSTTKKKGFHPSESNVNLIGQALQIAINELEKSNVNDECKITISEMKLLQNAFPSPKIAKDYNFKIIVRLDEPIGSLLQTIQDFVKINNIFCKIETQEIF